MRIHPARAVGLLRAPWIPGWSKDPLWRRARAVPSLDLRFADNKSLVDATTGQNLVTFSRASGGTYTDSQGVIRNAVTNLLLRSEEFDDASWVKTRSSVSQNTIVAPNGTLSADKLVEDTSAGTHLVTQGTPVAGIPYTYSFYAKAAERSRIIFTGGGFGAQGFAATFDVSSGTIPVNTGDKASIQPIGDGWYRCIVSFTPSNTVSFELYIDNGSTNNYTGDGTSGIYLWGAQLEQSSTVGEYVPTGATINSAPRFDHNPTTGESLGLLVEEARTNSIRNNTMVGAVAGTPGTLPTNWSGASTVDGLQREIVGTGVQNGVNYIDVRYSGTSLTGGSQVLLTFDGVTQIAALNGQVWTPSVYLSIAGGSASNISTLAIRHRYYDNTGAALTAQDTSVISNLSSTLQRFTGTAFTAANASIAFTMFLINADFVNSSVVDITLRIGLPQLEQGAFATSVIPTSGTAATRAADTCSLSGSILSSGGGNTLFAQFRSPASGTRPIVSLDDNSANERIELLTSGTDPKLLVTDGGVAQADIDAGAITANTSTRMAARFAANDFAASVGGNTSVIDTSGTMPTVDRIRIGRDQAGNYLNGHIARLAGWDSSLELLSSITQ